MEDLSIPLAVATGAFLALLLWRLRPAMPWDPGRKAAREALRAARARIDAATDARARAIALCDAADILSRRVAGAGGAMGLYLRALRADPSSPDLVERAAAGLATRPHSLESLLWRHLGASAWTGESVPAVRASLDGLRTLYEGRLHNAARARALTQARELVGGSPARSAGEPGTAPIPSGSPPEPGADD
jgi:hypothetical protein